MKRALAARAAETSVLASVEKLGAVSPYTVLPISRVDGVVTDGPAADTADLEAAGAAILHAAPTA